MNHIYNKLVTIALTVLLAATVSAQTARYKYVNSPEGLRVRDQATLSGNRIAGLTHMQKVKVAETGPAVTIDGITSNWIKIELPAVEWTSTEPTYGWVFGGYLTTTCDESSSGNITSLFTPSVKNTTPISLTANPSHHPIKRQDFTLPAGSTMNSYMLAKEFGVKLFVKKGNEYVWYDNLPPYTMVSVLDDSDATWYKTRWLEADCYVKKTDVIRGAIPGFTLNKAAIYSSKNANAATKKTVDPRTFIAITDFSNPDFVQTTEGWMKKDDVWFNQNDVLILQAFQRDLEIFSMDDREERKPYILMEMLQKSRNYDSTNLFYLEREALARAWGYARYTGYYGSDKTDYLALYLNNATIFGRYFADTASCFFQTKDYFIPTHGNYIADDLYKGLFAVADNGYRSCFWCAGNGAIVPLQPYYEPYGYRNSRDDRNLALNLNLANRAVKAKTDSEADRYINMLTWSEIVNNLSRYIGSDLRDRIQSTNQAIYPFFDWTSSYPVFHTIAKVPVQANPGTRFKTIGYIEAGTTCLPKNITTFWIKNGGGDSSGYVEWVLVETPGTTGWVQGKDLYTKDDTVVNQLYNPSRDTEEYYWDRCGRIREYITTCVLYSYNGSDVPVYAAREPEYSRDSAGKPTFVPDRNTAKPVGYITHGTKVQTMYMIPVEQGDDHDTWTVGHLFYVSDGTVEGWILPDNLVPTDMEGKENVFDAWLRYME